MWVFQWLCLPLGLALQPVISTLDATSNTLYQWDTSYIHRREAEKDTKIVGGKPAYPHSIPWQVALVLTNTSSIQCGGTIICDKYVLTAAHCYDDPRIKGISASSYQVLAGEHDFRDHSEGLRIDIKAFYIHPNRNISTDEYDVAILELTKPIALTSNTRAVCLPVDDTTGRPLTSFDISSNLKISGWGRVSDRGETSPVLKQADVPYINEEVCKSQYKSIEIDITSSMMCAGIIGIGGIDACNGDSGGPMTMVHDRKVKLLGLISFGTTAGCAHPDYPGVYAKISNPDILNWVQGFMEKCSYSSIFACGTISKELTEMGLSDCKWDQWGKWSSCSCNYGILQQTRTRKKLLESFGQGKKCFGSDKGTRACRKGLRSQSQQCGFSPNGGDKCLTVGGGKAGAKCVFPFSLEGITYQGCTSTHDPDDRLWCSTKTDSKGVHVSGQGEWGHCNSDCPADQGKLTETTAPIQPESCQKFYTESSITPRNHALPVGSNALKWSHPWVANFRRVGTNETVCSGTILDEFNILTAASMASRFVENSNKLKVVVGDLDKNEQDEEQEFDIASIHIHPMYGKLSVFDNDIAVVKLKPNKEAKGLRARGIKLQTSAAPACIPSEMSTYSTDIKCTVGCFRTNHIERKNGTNNLFYRIESRTMLSFSPPYIPLRTCIEPHVYGDDITSSMFCAGYLEGGRPEPCIGCGGGGYVCLENGVYQVRGIISWGQGCGLPNKPTVYTNVSKFHDWILEKMEA